jgi:hypothetical protein
MPPWIASWQHVGIIHSLRLCHSQDMPQGSIVLPNRSSLHLAKKNPRSYNTSADRAVLALSISVCPIS